MMWRWCQQKLWYLHASTIHITFQRQGGFLETASCLPSPSLGVASCGGGFCVASVVLSSSGPCRGNFHFKNSNQGQVALRSKNEHIILPCNYMPTNIPIANASYIPKSTPLTYPLIDDGDSFWGMIRTHPYESFIFSPMRLPL